MKTYSVTWSIDVEAVSPRDAARAAMDMQDDYTTANVFVVRETGESGDGTMIDLGDIPRCEIL